jgi:hypothetical protein
MVILLFGAGHLRVTHPFATDPLTIKQGSPFDLHVLGTPPAFILSQDQTLRKMIYGIDQVPYLSYHSSVVKVLHSQGQDYITLFPACQIRFSFLTYTGS